MAISFVGSASSQSTSGSSFTITKPTNVQSGDLMLAFLGIYQDGGGEEVAITPPAGWTLQNGAFVTNGAEPHQLAVMTRIAGSSEPGSWSGSADDPMNVKVCVSVAYRGATVIEDDGVTSMGSGTSLNTATVNNTASTNWRLTVGSYTANSLTSEIDSNEVTERRIAGQTSSEQDVEVGAWDSNGNIGTGNTSRNISRGSSWRTAASWIGILSAVDNTVSGTLDATLLLPTMLMDGKAGIDAVLDVDLPLLTMTAAGIASSPEGTLDTVIMPVVDVTAGVEGQATLDTTIMPVMDIVTETKPFGVRVVSVPAEKRRMLIFYRDLIPDFIGEVERFEGPIIIDIPIGMDFAGNVDIRALAEHVSVGVSAFDVTSILEEVEVFPDIAAPVTVAVFQPSIAITANAGEVEVTADARPITRAGGSTFPQPDAVTAIVVVNDPIVSTEG